MHWYYITNIGKVMRKADKCPIFGEQLSGLKFKEIITRVGCKGQTVFNISFSSNAENNCVFFKSVIEQFSFFMESFGY